MWCDKGPSAFLRSRHDADKGGRARHADMGDICETTYFFPPPPTPPFPRTESSARNMASAVATKAASCGSPIRSTATRAFIAADSTLWGTLFAARATTAKPVVRASSISRFLMSASRVPAAWPNYAHQHARPQAPRDTRMRGGARGCRDHDHDRCCISRMERQRYFEVDKSCRPLALWRRLCGVGFGGLRLCVLAMGFVDHTYRDRSQALGYRTARLPII
jgi:hypothetical protein